MKTHRKIIYRPGLISLIFLPLLLLWHLSRQGIFEKFSVLEVNNWNPYLAAQYPAFSEMETHPERKYTEIVLKGNKKSDLPKLDFAQLKIKQLTQSSTLTGGVHIRFEDSAKYWEMIAILDILSIEKTKMWTIFNNDIWVFNVPKSQASKNQENAVPRFMCGNCCIPTEQTIPTKLVKWDRFYPFLVLFLLMGGAAVLEIYFRHFEET